MPHTLQIKSGTTSQNLLAAAEHIPQRHTSLRNNQALAILSATREQNINRIMQEQQNRANPP